MFCLFWFCFGLIFGWFDLLEFEFVVILLYLLDVRFALWDCAGLRGLGLLCLHCCCGGLGVCDCLVCDFLSLCLGGLFSVYYCFALSFWLWVLLFVAGLFWLLVVISCLCLVYVFGCSVVGCLWLRVVFVGLFRFVCCLLVCCFVVCFCWCI